MCVLLPQHMSVRPAWHAEQQQARRINSTLLHVVSSPLQAIKTCLNYLSETNGELHFFLHNYVSACRQTASQHQHPATQSRSSAHSSGRCSSHPLIKSSTAAACLSPLTHRRASVLPAAGGGAPAAAGARDGRGRLAGGPCQQPPVRGAGPAPQQRALSSSRSSSSAGQEGGQPQVGV